METKHIYTFLLLMMVFIDLKAQWTNINIPNSTQSYKTSYFINSNNGFVAGTERIRRTSDGGLTWDTCDYGIQRIEFVYTIIEKIIFVNGNVGIAAGFNFHQNSEYVFKTYDGGLTWNTITHQGLFGSALNDMCFANSTTGYCCGKAGVIIKTTDAGEHWNYLTTGTSIDMMGIYFTSATTGYSVGQNTILKTTDGGNTWNPQTISGASFNTIYFINATTGFAAGDKIYKTTDAGATWNIVYQPGNIYEVTSINSDTLFAAADGEVLKSNDGGNTWFNQYTFSAQDKYYGVYFYNSTLGFVMSDDSHVFRTNSCGLPIQQNDAGVSAVNSLTYGQCQGVQPVTVSLKNYGSANLTNASIGWSVNGVTQPTYNWTGNLNSYAIDSTINIGNYNFPTGNSTVTTYTLTANSVPDYIHANDTSTAVINVSRMSGLYTIGGANPDYVDLDPAFTDLINRGICGNVQLKIRNGTYNSYLLSDYPRNSPTDSVFIYSESGDSSQVIINGQIVLTHAKNVLFRQLTFKSTATSSNLIQLGDSVKNITFENCIFDIPSGNAGINQSSKAFEDLTITNCLFKTGSTGISLYSTAGTSKRLSITNCTFNDLKSDGISIQYTDDIIFKNNTINGPIGIPIFNFISFKSCSSSLNFSFNKLRGDLATAIIEFNNCKYSFSSEGLVYNNFIACSGKGIPLSISNCSHIKLMYNTIVTQDDWVMIFGYSDTTFSPLLTFKNNIVCNNKKQLLIRIPNVQASPAWYNSIFQEMGYNAYFAKPGYDGSNNAIFADAIGRSVNSLSEWIGNFSLDSTSVYIDPQFVSALDYHIYPNTTNYHLNAAGGTIPGITTDIDNNLRDALHPDIGCSEFNVVPVDAGPGMLSKNQRICSGVNPISIRIRNYSINPLTHLNINWSVNNQMQSSTSWNGIIPSGSALTYDFNIGTYSFIHDSTYIIKVWTDSPNYTNDLVQVNDTISDTLIAKGLSGIYTIGGANPNYNTFTDAVNALTTEGICGSVTFQVRPGIYNESLYFRKINGVSGSDTVVFQSSTGDSTSVILQSTTNDLITLDTTSFVSYKQITFLDSSAAQHFIVNLKHHANHLNFSNCIFRGNYFSICNDGFAVSDINFDRNIFRGVQQVMQINTTGSNSAAYNSRIRIVNNSFQFRTNGISISRALNINIENNYFENFNTSPIAVKAIYLYNIQGSMHLMNNIINCNSYYYGIDYYGIGPLNDNQIIANNTISMNGNSTNNAIQLDGKAIKCIYNSVRLDGVVAATTPAVFLNSSEIEVYNNSFFNNAGGPAIRFANIWNGITDYNNYYSTSLFPFYAGGQHIDLQTWQTNSGKDAHSISFDPQHNSITDLHCNIGSPLNNGGVYIPEVTTDIDGDIRSVIAPDMGADEFSQNDSLVWPGDCNYDGQANQYDLLSIGLFYGNAGNPRSIVSNSWLGYQCANWGSLQNSGHDMKHVDCNGDGAINILDTVAIIQNWGLAHPFRHGINNNIAMSSLPSMRMIHQGSIFMAGDTVNIDIILGDSLNPLPAIYSIGFDVTLNSSSLVQAGSMELTFPNGIIGVINQNAVAVGQTTPNISVAITRYNHIDTSGSGIVAHLKFRIDPSATVGNYLFLHFNNYLALKANSDTVYLSVFDDSIPINIPNNVNSTDLFKISIYPNPVSDVLFIDAISENTNDMDIRLVDLLGGRNIFSRHLILIPGLNKYKLNLNSYDLSQGTYLLNILTKNANYSKRILLMK